MFMGCEKTFSRASESSQRGQKIHGSFATIDFAIKDIIFSEEMDIESKNMESKNVVKMYRKDASNG